MNNELRKRCKMLKALQDITYTELASYIELSASSFYNWLCGNYDFGIERQKKLIQILDTLEE